MPQYCVTHDISNTFVHLARQHISVSLHRHTSSLCAHNSCSSLMLCTGDVAHASFTLSVSHPMCIPIVSSPFVACSLPIKLQFQRAGFGSPTSSSQWLCMAALGLQTRVLSVCRRLLYL